MYRNDVYRILKKKMIGEWSTDKDDIRDTVIDIMDELDIDYSADDDCDAVYVMFDDEDGKEQEIVISYELVGRTWSVRAVI